MSCACDNKEWEGGKEKEWSVAEHCWLWHDKQGKEQNLHMAASLSLEKQTKLFDQGNAREQLWKEWYLLIP